LIENGNVVATSGFQSTSSAPQFSYVFNLNSRAHPLAAGAHIFTVYYPGDASWNPATSTSLSVTITPIAPTMSLTSNLGTFGSVVQGTAIMYSAKMTGVLGVAGGIEPYPTGAVQFYVDGVAAGGPVPLVNGVAAFSTSALTTGQHTITAGFGGDSFYTSATTSGVVTVVTQGPDILTLTSATPSNGALGASIAVSGTLTAGAFGPAPTGTVTLLDNGQGIASANLAGSSPFALAFTVDTARQPIAAGTHNFTLRYGGEAHWTANTSAAAVVTLAKGTTSTVVNSSGSTALVGSSVAFTAAIAQPGFVPATGTVQFFDGTAALGSPVAVSNGSAVYATNALAAGTHSITAVYSGDANYAASTSASLLETITSTTKGTASITLTASNSSVAINTNVTFTAALAVSQGSPAPTGTVQFYDGAATLGSPVPVANSSASYSTSTLAGGSHSISAAYSGDDNYSPSTSAVVTESVEDFSFQAGTATLTINAGGSGTSVLTITPEGGFNVSTSFACSGLPQGATCSFSPATLTGSGTTTLTIATTGSQATVSRPSIGWRSAAGTTLIAGAFWLILPLPGRSRRQKLGGLTFLLFVCLGVFAGCGGGSSSKPTTGNSGTPAGTYKVTVTATSGSGTSAIVHTTAVTVIVR
jgi:Bacterial Ig-like domain (group 3)